MKIRVEVVYALPERQWVISLELPAGATVSQALAAAAIENLLPPEAQRPRAGVGIWGRAVPLDRSLRDGDRVEVYRALRADPKTMRRQRAAHLVKR
jgi:putative ubiquitin-RnfH superfamily antitoxin RatB of RatAB toxin-antitoxin module